MATRLTRTPLPGRRMTEAAFAALVGLLAEPAPLDVLITEELVVVVGRGVGDDVEFVEAALEMLILLPIVE